MSSRSVSSVGRVASEGSGVASSPSATASASSTSSSASTRSQLEHRRDAHAHTHHHRRHHHHAHAHRKDASHSTSGSNHSKSGQKDNNTREIYRPRSGTESFDSDSEGEESDAIPRVLKVVVVGENGTGKSNLKTRFVHDAFTLGYVTRACKYSYAHSLHSRAHYTHPLTTTHPLNTLTLT
jgi:hypothetical protein